MSKTIAFYDNSLSERGTAIALFDYAFHNQTILKNKSVVFYNKNDTTTHPRVVEKFQKHFKVYAIDRFEDIEKYKNQENIDIVYAIRYGHDDKVVTKLSMKTAVHCVFLCNQPHGTKFAAISPYVKGCTSKTPVVPHMIHLSNTTKDMRKKLNIPKDAFVFGRYGGKTSFNVSYVHEAIKTMLEQYSNVYFLFANTRNFYSHEKIIYLDTIVDMDEKTEFINTTDAMIHARMDGETFGLAIGEFSTLNKPVLTCRGTYNAHIEFLGDKGFIFSNKEECLEHMKMLAENYETFSQYDWNAYKQFTPQNVMQQFKKVFL